MGQQNDSLKIKKLKQMNDKLTKELKSLTSTLEKSTEKFKQKPKYSTDATVQAKEKELDALDKQVKAYQKEILTLKDKMNAKTEYRLIIDLENKLKDSETKTAELQKQAVTLEQILHNQEKELEKLKGGTEGSAKLKSLQEQLKVSKERNKELEKKIQGESSSYQKQHTTLLNLQEKVHKLKQEKMRWKKAIAEKLPEPFDEEYDEESKRSEEEILNYSLNTLQKRLKGEKAAAAKALEATKTEIEQFQTKVKEAEQEQKLNTAKLAELKKQLRHNQLKPLEENGEGGASESADVKSADKKEVDDEEKDLNFYSEKKTSKRTTKAKAAADDEDY